MCHPMSPYLFPTYLELEIGQMETISYRPVIQVDRQGNLQIGVGWKDSPSSVIGAPGLVLLRGGETERVIWS